jgi:hypothetical protein
MLPVLRNSRWYRYVCKTTSPLPSVRRISRRSHVRRSGKPSDQTHSRALAVGARIIAHTKPSRVKSGARVSGCAPLRNKSGRLAYNSKLLRESDDPVCRIPSLLYPQASPFVPPPPFFRSLNTYLRETIEPTKLNLILTLTLTHTLLTWSPPLFFSAFFDGTVVK